MLWFLVYDIFLGFLVYDIFLLHIDIFSVTFLLNLKFVH